MTQCRSAPPLVEYAIANALVFPDDLPGFTRNATDAAFISPDERTKLLQNCPLAFELLTLRSAS
jgi:hypothetical protein